MSMLHKYRAQHALYKKENEAMSKCGHENKHRCSCDRGFTILEVVVALAIFSVGVMAIAGLQVSATNGDLRARLATEAATLAHDQAENLLSIHYDPDVAPPIEEFRDITVANYDSFPTNRETTVGRYTVDWLVVSLTDPEVTGVPNPLPPPPVPITRALRITVRVNWEYFGDDKQYELEFVKIADI